MGSAESRNVIQSVANVSVKASNSAIQNVVSSGRSFQGVNVSNVAEDVVIRGVRMDGTVRMSVAALLDVMQTNDVQQTIAQEMEQMAKASVSGINLGNSSKTSNTVNTVINASVDVSNIAAQTCNTSAVSTQVINVADIGGSVTVEDVDMRSAIDVLVDCRMKAIQGNSAIQDMQQSVKQTAISETVGFDPAALLWAIVAVIAVAGAVVVGFMYTTSKISGPITSRLLPFLLAVGILLGAGFLIMMLLSSIDQVQPPAGVSREDNILQYPFLDPAVLADECKPAVFTERQGLDTLEKLSDWVKVYNQRAEKHNAKVLAAVNKDSARFDAIAFASGEDIGDGPLEDASTELRWPIIKFAHLNQRTGRASAYAGEKANQLRLWSQWGPTNEPIAEAAKEFGPNVYRPNPRFTNTTTYNAIQLLREGQALLEFLRCLSAGVGLRQFSMTQDGMTVCAAEIQKVRDLAEKATNPDGKADLERLIDRARFDIDTLFTLPNIRAQALWHMLSSRPHTERLAANALDTLVPTNLTSANMTEDARKVAVPNIIDGLAEPRRVVPLVYQLTAVYRDLLARPNKSEAVPFGVDKDALAVWNAKFGEWKRKFEAGWDTINTGNIGDPASWKDVTLAFVSRLDPVTSIAFNATSEEPTFVSVWVWVGVIAVAAVLLALGGYAAVSAKGAKKRREDKLAKAKEEGEVAKAKAGVSGKPSGGGSNWDASELLGSLLFSH